MTCVDRPSFLIKKTSCSLECSLSRASSDQLDGPQKIVSPERQNRYVSGSSSCRRMIAGGSEKNVTVWERKKKYIIMRSKYALTDPSHGSHPSTCSRILVPAERLFKLSSHTHEGNTTTPICVKGVYAAGSPELFLSSLHFPIEERNGISSSQSDARGKKKKKT